MINVFRFEFNSSSSTFGPTDPMATLWGVSTWLRSLGTSVVSHFDFFRLADIYRLNFDVATLTPGSNDPIGTYWIVSV